MEDALLYLEGTQSGSFQGSFTFDWQRNCAMKCIQSYSFFFFFGEQEKLLAENKR